MKQLKAHNKKHQNKKYVGTDASVCPKHQRNTQKGITLIALIITIIVLLILAIVSIRLVVNNGILGKAEYATQKYSEEEAAEQEKLLKAEYEMAKYEGKFSGTYTDYVLDKKFPGLKVGDYVNYDPTAGATETQMTYTSYSLNNASSDKNNGRTSGWDSDQSFDARTYKNAGYKWQVLDVKDGKIRLISSEYVGPGNYSDQNRTTYYLKGQAGYINGVEELNTICGIFGHGKGAASATSITVDDINAITGYNPRSPRFHQGSWSEYESEVTYTRGDGIALTSSAKLKSTKDPLTLSGSQSTFNYFDSITRTFKPLTGATTIESTYYYYCPAKVNSSFLTGGVNKDGTINTTSFYQMLFGGTAVGSDGYTRNFTLRNNQYFWLASEYAAADYYCAHWGLRYVYEGYVNFGRLYISDGSTDSPSYGVRPVVSLKSDIQLEPNGNNNWKIK